MFSQAIFDGDILMTDNSSELKVKETDYSR